MYNFSNTFTYFLIPMKIALLKSLTTSRKIALTPFLKLTVKL